MPKERGQESHVQALTSLIESLSSYGSRFNNETIIPEQKKMKEPLKNNKLPRFYVSYFIVNKPEGDCSLEWISKGIKLIEDYPDFLLHPRVTMKLLELYCLSGQSEKAANLLFQESSSMSQMHYNFVMNYFVKQRKMENVDTLYNLMKSQNLVPDRYTYSIIMNMYNKIDLPAKVEKTFLEALSNSIAPNAVMYTSLLTSFLKSNELEKAQYILDELLTGKARVKLDALLFKVMLNYYCSVGQVQNVCKILSEMEKNGIPKDSAIYTALSGLYQILPRQVINDYHYLFDIDNATELSPLSHQNILIDRHLKKGDHDKAVQVFDSMEEKGITPDHSTYLLMMNSSLSEKKYDRVQQLFDQVITSNESIPTSQLYIIFHTMLKMYRRLKKEEKLKSTLQLMKEKGLTPDLITYSLLISYYGDLFKFEKCLEILAEMHAEGITPDIGLYNSLMVYAKRLPGNNSILTIESIVERMKKYEIKYDVRTFILALDVLFKNVGLSAEEKREQANEIFERMRAEGYSPTVDVFICLLRHALDPDDAFSIYGKMKAMNIRPSKPQVFESMISVCLRKGKDSDGKTLFSILQIFDLMVEEGMKPTVSQINVCLGFCNKVAEKKVASRLLEIMEENGVTPNTITFVHRMRIFPDQAEATFLEAREMRHKIDLQPLAYNSFLDTLINTKSLSVKTNVPKVKKYLRIMQADGIQFCCKTYTLMISFYYIIGEREAIPPLDYEIEKRGLPYTFPCIKKLMKIQAMLGDDTRLHYYYKKLNTSNELKPDIDVYCILIEFYKITKDFNSGFEILEEIIHAKMRNTRLSPRKVIREFLTASQSNHAEVSDKVPFHDIMQSCLQLGLI